MCVLLAATLAVACLARGERKPGANVLAARIDLRETQGTEFVTNHVSHLTCEVFLQILYLLAFLHLACKTANKACPATFGFQRFP